MSRARRSRFTVSLRAADGGQRREVVLAYSPLDAQLYYERKGFTVTGVRKGDFRLADRPSGVQSRLLHAEALSVAREFFGIALPLDIAQDSRQGGRWGVHNLVPYGPGVRLRGGRVYNIDFTEGWSHRIRVKSWCDPVKAGETLWHELAHAMQAERDVMPTWDATGDARLTLSKLRTSYYDGTTYLDKPWEVEARSYEAFNAERPLAR